MENSGVVEEKVGSMVDLNESAANEKVENVTTLTNESTIQSNNPIIADETSSKNVSDGSVISVDYGSSDSPRFQCNEDDDTIELDIEEVSQSDHCEAKVVQIGSNTADEAGPFVTQQSIAEPEQQLEISKMERIQESDKGTIMKQDEGVGQSRENYVCDAAISNNHPSNVADLQTSNDEDCEEDLELDRRIEFLDTLVDKSFNYAKTGLDRNYDSLQKFCNELLQGRKKCLEEMTNNAECLKSILHTATSVKDKIKKSGLVDHLEACFSFGHWMDLSFKPKRVDDCKASMKDFVSSNYKGVTKVQHIFEECLGSKSAPPQENILQDHRSSGIEPCLVTVTAVQHPGSFYIVRCSDLDARRSLFNSLEENAHSFPVPEEIIIGEQYAVCNNTSHWSRGVCGKICGDYNCGDLSGKLYEFFLPDHGSSELINSLSIRVLPQDLMDAPKMAKECSLNQNFNWNDSATWAFKQMVRRSPMNMKVLSSESGILIVDLAQLACFGEDNTIVSVRSALGMRGDRPMTNKPLVEEAPAKRIKPKFSESPQPAQFIGLVTSPFMPNNIYVQVADEQLNQFREMQQQLQIEFKDANNTSPSFIKQPRKGYTYAIKYSDNIWYRILVEDIPREYVIFYIDTGHRNFVHRPECHQLPDRYFQLPAQAVRCTLAGISQPSLQRNVGRIGASRPPMQYPREIRKYLEPLKGKEVMIFSVNWLAGGAGLIKHINDKEMATLCIMYENESRCLNHVLAQSKLVKSDRNHVYPGHNEKLLEWSRISGMCTALEVDSSADISTDSDGTLTHPVPGSSNGACPLTPPAEKNEEFHQLQNHSYNQQVIDDLHFLTQSSGEIEARAVTSRIALRMQGVDFGAIPKKLDFSSHCESEVVANMGTQPLEHELGNEELINLDEKDVPLAPVRTATTAWKPCEFSIKENEEFRGKVTGVNTEGEIFLHDARLAPKLLQLGQWINEAYDNTQPSDADLNCKPGDLCIAKHEVDGGWYRAVVLEVCSEPRRVTVEFVDYGTHHSIGLENIRLNIQFEEIPIFALRCTLHNIRVPGSGINSWDQLGDAKVPWPKETLDTLHSMTVDKEFRVTIKKNGVPLQVHLNSINHDGVVNKNLVKRGLAEFVEIPRKFTRKNKNKNRK